MRTIVDLPEEQLASLRELCEREGISRAEAIRRAVCAFVAQSKKERRDALLDEAFGAWAHMKIDARQYVDELRNEWDERERRLGL